MCAQDMVVTCATSENTVDDLTPSVSAVRANDDVEAQSTSDQDDVWSDCAAELTDDRKPTDGNTATNQLSLTHNYTCSAAPVSSTCSVAPIGSTCSAAPVCSIALVNPESGMENESAAKCSQDYLECPLTDCTETGVGGVTTSEEPAQLSPTANHMSATTAVTTTTADNTTKSPATSTKDTSSTASKTTSMTTACTTSLTTTTASSKSERPRASPCRATQLKHTQPVTNGK